MERVSLRILVPRRPSVPCPFFLVSVVWLVVHRFRGPIEYDTGALVRLESLGQAGGQVGLYDKDMHASCGEQASTVSWKSQPTRNSQPISTKPFGHGKPMSPRLTSVAYRTSKRNKEIRTLQVGKEKEVGGLQERRSVEVRGYGIKGKGKKEDKAVKEQCRQ